MGLFNLPVEGAFGRLNEGGCGRLCGIGRVG